MDVEARSKGLSPLVEMHLHRVGAAVEDVCNLCDRKILEIVERHGLGLTLRQSADLCPKVIRFGWEFAEHEGAPTAYWIIKNQGQDNGGMMLMTEEWGEIPPHWMVYFAVADTDATAATIETAGGKIVVPPFDTPVGKIAVVSDTHGAIFSLIAMSQPPHG